MSTFWEHGTALVKRRWWLGCENEGKGVPSGASLDPSQEEGARLRLETEASPEQPERAEAPPAEPFGRCEVAVAAERVLALPAPHLAANTLALPVGHTPTSPAVSSAFVRSSACRSLAPPGHPRLQSGHHQVRMDSGRKQGLWSWCPVRIHLLHFPAQWPSRSLRTHTALT